ncbi:MAG TPA: hypothetical protein PKD72_00925 [Gemmatales bacterium]|nr:hypothetical protein [Gemmatales bacterium]
MSSAPTSPAQPPPPPPGPAAPGKATPQEIIIYGHTALFYWWPAWFFGFLFAFLTYWGDHRAAIIPNQSQYDEANSSIKVQDSKGPVKLDKTVHGIGENNQFRERMSVNSSLGIIYVFILLLVIIITTVPLRGISSLVVIVTLALIVVSISALGLWDNILNALGSLRIHMNMGFYVFFSSALFIAWALVFFVFDRMNYWRFTPGQITHKYVFGGGERSFDTEGLAFTKLRDDLFRHLILGLGSGDLMMDPLKAGGANKDDLAIHNVLFIGSKLESIEKLISKQGMQLNRMKSQS